MAAGRKIRRRDAWCAADEPRSGLTETATLDISVLLSLLKAEGTSEKGHPWQLRRKLGW